MFVTIRRYTPKSANLTGANLEGVRRKLHDEFVPIIQKLDGFHGYYCLTVGGKELISVGIFENRESGAESTRRAKDYLKKNPLPVDLGQPEVSEGEVLTYAEPGVGAH
jgi:hypothetical protein